METTRAAYKLVKDLNVDAPIITVMRGLTRQLEGSEGGTNLLWCADGVLFEGLSAAEGIKMLATREMKSESYGWDVTPKM